MNTDNAYRTATDPTLKSPVDRWAITGASQGFGRAMTEEVLRRGRSVVAVVRDPASLADLAAEHGPRFAVLTADLRDGDALAEVARTLGEADIDVLVNNAGRAIVGAAEEVGIDELREQIDLNFLAAAGLSKAVLPAMRRKRRGTIVQMSSQGGRLSFPGVGAYSAGKFALEGWSEALATEVSPLGVRVMIVEPSRFRTGFNSAHSLHLTEEVSAYSEAVGPVRAELTDADGIQEGDPVRAARIIVDLVEGDQLPLRLPLGAEAVRRLRATYKANASEVERWADVAASADFPDAPVSERTV